VARYHSRGPSGPPVPSTLLALADEVIEQGRACADRPTLIQSFCHEWTTVTSLTCRGVLPW